MNNQVWATGRLKQAREGLGLAQKDMAEYLRMMADIDISDSTYQKWESQQQSVSGVLGLKIAQTLEVPFPELFTKQVPVRK